MSASVRSTTVIEAAACIDGIDRKRSHHDNEPEYSEKPVGGQSPQSDSRATGDEEAAPAALPGKPLERWNETPINTFRYLTTLFSFIIMGMNDAATGVRIRRRYPGRYIS